MLLAAATTQRAIGWVIFALAIVGFVVYILFNLRSGKREVSAEIELAPNRKPYHEDEALESSRLTHSLLFAFGMLVLIAVGLPAYWLGEPARHANADQGFDQRSASRGEELYVAQCQQCHGPGGSGGVREVALTEPSGDFLATVSWKAPALTAVMSRFSEDEVLQVLNYGRNGVMPAFGAPGGGPFTTQQLDDLIHYLREIQLSEDDLRADVESGLRDGARALLLEEDEFVERLEAIDDIPEDAADRRAAAQEEFDADLEAAIDELLEEASDPNSPEFASVYGRLLFNNTAAQGAYSCARCHTQGWSYDAEDVENLDGEPLVDEFLDGGGAFGPPLVEGATVRRFLTTDQHVTFITAGSQDGQPYLPGVPSNGSGQMPGFGSRSDDDLGVTWAAILTEEQIAAIVAYERSL
jgi:mono/diheme cytochrome c family protein